MVRVSIYRGGVHRYTLKASDHDYGGPASRGKMMTVLSVKISATKGQGDMYEVKAAAYVTHPDGPKWQLLTRQNLVVSSPANVPRAVVLALLSALSDRGD